MSRKRPQPKKTLAVDPVLPQLATQLATAENSVDIDHANSLHAPTQEALITSPLTSAKWTSLRKRILNDQRQRPLSTAFGKAAAGGVVYRWGLAGSEIDSGNVNAQWLTHLGTGTAVRGKAFRGIEPAILVSQFQTTVRHGAGAEWVDAWSALVWAAAMPALLDSLEEHQWWSLLGTIQEFREQLLDRPPTDPIVLLGVAEIGITLALGLRVLPSCRRLASSSLQAFKKWCEQDDLAVSAALADPNGCRIVLASLLRQRLLLPEAIRMAAKSKTADKSKKHRVSAFEKAIDAIGIELATWVAATTRHGGATAFTTKEPNEFCDDLGAQGLFRHAAELEKESLHPAMMAALGQSKTKGRLAWQVSLPESMLHDEQARLACLLPEWDVRRGRAVIDYAGQDTRLELTAGKSPLLSGRCETQVIVDGKPLSPRGDWVATCEYSDDDIHYLELEQTLQDDYVLQRQFMVVREDRCFLFADAIVAGTLRQSTGAAASDAPARDLPMIEYLIRFPLAATIEAKAETETNEFVLCGNKPLAVAIPLSAAEWKQSHSPARMQATDDRHLLLSARGQGQLFVPLWIDLSRNRLPLSRTWRSLTVGENLRLIDARSAVAYRIQVAKSQWLLYRSMSPAAPRTFFGKHMTADFYCARFDAKKETYEDLITVEENVD